MPYVYMDVLVGQVRSPGPGTWEITLRYKGGNKKTTKNVKGEHPFIKEKRLHLLAVLEGLRLIKSSCKIYINCKCAYVSKGLNHNLKIWANNDWLTKKNKDIKNKDIWMEINDIMKSKNIEILSKLPDLKKPYPTTIKIEPDVGTPKQLSFDDLNKMSNNMSKHSQVV